MLRMQKCLLFWMSVLLRLVFLSLRCDARAVNVSNTWTMPQEDLNVFYRFFRDRISWFEADAVCQFHHANLVTVDNSFQFDATRDLLRELDVNDIVWIGLLRPQNSDRFMWSNSRPLVTDTGYWAEALPLMDAPLCAVIDPIRDYRWHALRCGGPETASFLCEMPVPAWADVCLIKDMPNLTMQYMADTASIELIRNCQQEGLLRQTCKGQADRERAMVELICPKERLEAQRINDMTNSHFKSLHIINSISTDNNEKNEIELVPVLPRDGEAGSGSRGRVALHGQQQQNTVQHLIEQFSVDDLMQADEPTLGCVYEDTLQPRPEKKYTKKLLTASDKLAKERKAQRQLQRGQRRQEEQQQHKQKVEEMMMGDQPMAEEHVPIGREEDEAADNNEIFELLPHRKRILSQDLKSMTGKEDIDIKATTTTAAATTTSTSITPIVAERTTTPTLAITMTKSTADTLKTTTTTQLTNEAAPITTTTTTTNTQTTLTHNDDDMIASRDRNANNALPTARMHELSSSLSSVTIGHAMHPAPSRDDPMHAQLPTQQQQQQQQQRQQSPHSKESSDSSHFIPPMLLVKSHYVPLAKHEHEHEHNAGPEFNDQNKQHHHHNGQPNQHRRTSNQHREQHKALVDTSAADTATKTEATLMPPLMTSKVTVEATKLAIVDADDDNTPAYNAQTEPTLSEDNLTTNERNTLGTENLPAATTTTTPTTPTATIAITTTNASHTNNSDSKRERQSMSTSATTTVKALTEHQNTVAAKIIDTNVTTATTLPTTIATVKSGKRVEQIEMASHEVTNPETVVDIVPTTTTTTTKSDITIQQKLVINESKTNNTTIKTKATATETETSSIELKTFSETETIKTQPTTTKSGTLAATSETTATISTETFPTSTAAAVTAPPSSTLYTATTTRSFFVDAVTEAQYKPNRRRSLTKPETQSYFKKILG